MFDLTKLYRATLGRIAVMRRHPSIVLGLIVSIAEALEKVATNGHLTPETALPVVAGILIHTVVSPSSPEVTGPHN